MNIWDFIQANKTDIYSNFYDFDVAFQTPEEADRLLCFRDGPAIYGFCEVFKFSSNGIDYAMISYLYVAPAYRRNLVGTMLVSEICRKLKDRKIVTYATNNSFKLFKKLGFTKKKSLSLMEFEL